ncbi:MAG TPA: rhamnogalacturonan acetylesterase [Phycisphaerae bacterium]|jgi:lysophospholipase L1-like esterase|nr:rhamnogalacturonan acetylesterase [Phycisphaerae bacterium]
MTDLNWLPRIAIFCMLIPLAGASLRADDARPVVDDSQFGKDTPAPSTRPRLFLIGDSTVKSGGGNDTGWGEVINRYFDPQKIDVVNRAIAGRSTRSYTFEGKWDLVLKEMKAGDFVMIQFGHNDFGNIPYNDPRSKWRSPLPGDGDEGVDFVRPKDDGSPGEKEVVHTYGWYLRKYGTEARAKGATVIFCSMVPHKDFTPDGKIKRAERQTLVTYMRNAASRTGNLFLDLNEIVAEGYEQLGPEKVNGFFADARTHTNAAGADYTAQHVIAGLKGSWPTDPLDAYLNAAGRAIPAAKVNTEPATKLADPTTQPAAP